MPRCPACREWIDGERDQVGARCPYCRLPLYERPELFKPRPPSTGNLCTVHPGSPALGACQRCGNFQCDLCRTRWRDRWLCVACVERSLEAGEVRPEETRAHVWQAVLSLVLGLASWVLTVLAILLVAAAGASGKIEPGLAVLFVLVLFSSPVPAVFGVGLGAAALYGRGHHMILATIGLILSGLHAGAFIGLLSFALWNNVS
jgi:hypothetical protein